MLIAKVFIILIGSYVVWLLPSPRVLTIDTDSYQCDQKANSAARVALESFIHFM